MVNSMTADTAALPSTTILVLDDNHQTFETVAKLFTPAHTILHADSVTTAKELLNKNEVGVLVCNEYLSKENTLYFMADINKTSSLVQPILMSQGLTEELASIAINEAGVIKYLKLPLNKNQLLDAIKAAIGNHQQAVEAETLKQKYNSALQEMHGIPYMARKARQTTRILLHNANDLTAAAGTTVVILLGIFFTLGVTVVIGLYILKTIFGIDIFADSHFAGFIAG